jgi:hypothetical protein
LSTAVEAAAATIQNPIDWVGSETTGSNKILDMSILLEQRPPGPSERLQDIIRRGEEVQSTAAAIDAVVRDADKAASAIPGEARSLAESGASSGAQPGAPAGAPLDHAPSRAHVAAATEQLLQDVICSIAVASLSPGETARFATGRALFTALTPLTTDALGAEIQRRTASDVTSAFAAQYPWAAHAERLLETADRYAREFEGEIKGPDLVITEAYVYGIRNCLERPTPASVAAAA